MSVYTAALLPSDAGQLITAVPEKEVDASPHQDKNPLTRLTEWLPGEVKEAAVRSLFRQRGFNVKVLASRCDLLCPQKLWHIPNLITAVIKSLLNGEHNERFPQTRGKETCYFTCTRCRVVALSALFCLLLCTVKTPLKLNIWFYEYFKARLFQASKGIH